VGPQGAAFCGNSALRSWGLDQCMQWDARMPLVDGGRRYDSDGFRLAWISTEANHPNAER